MNEEKLCQDNGFNNMKEVKDVIYSAWSKKLFAIRPQVFILMRALGVARIYLGTNDLEEVIKWSKQ